MTRWWIAATMAFAALALQPGTSAAAPDKAMPQATKPSVTTAPSPAPQASAPGWGARCESTGRGEPLTCQASESAVLTQTGQILVEVGIRVPQDTRTPVALVQIPVGVFLPSGLQLQIDDGTKLDLPLQTCEQRGCFAGTPLTPKILNEMRGGKSLKVRFDNLNKQRLTVTLPLNGFGPAYEKIR